MEGWSVYPDTKPSAAARKLAGQVEADGGTVLSLYQDPVGGHWQIFGLLLMHAALVGIAITCITGVTSSTRLGAAVAVAFLVYFAREGHLGSHWFANVFMLVYLPFQVAAASVASGRTNHRSSTSSRCWPTGRPRATCRCASSWAPLAC